jgi:hypothetical protein
MAEEKTAFKNIQEIVDALDGTTWEDDAQGTFRNKHKFYKKYGRFYYLLNTLHPVELSCRNDNGVFVCDAYQYGTQLKRGEYTFHIHDGFQKMDMNVKLNAGKGHDKKLTRLTGGNGKISA